MMPLFQCCSCDFVETLNFMPDACSSCGNAFLVDLEFQMRTDEEAAIIAVQNDLFRTTFGTDASIPGRFFITPGVSNLEISAQKLIAANVIRFNKFNGDNDPWGQHDFGSFSISHAGETIAVYWKIDLYDAEYLYGSEEPSNPTKTRRVLTILLPDEY